MKVKARGKYLYFQYYDPERKRTIMVTTGLENNIPNYRKAKNLLEDIKAQKRMDRFDNIWGVKFKTKHTFEEAFKLFSEDLITKSGRMRSKSSTHGYHRVATLFVKYCGNKLINEYTQKETKNFIAGLRQLIIKKDKQLSENSIANYTRHLYSLFNYFKQNKWIEENPVIKVKPVKIPPKTILPEHRKIILNYIRDNEPAMFKIIIFILLTGLRKNDVVKLKWENIDFERKIIRIPDPKGQQPAYLPLSTPAELILKSINKKSEKDTVFNYTYDQIRRFNKMSLKAGLKERYTLHNLRKTFTSNLLNNNLSLLKVSMLIDHKDTEITKEHYFESNIKSLRKDLDKSLTSDDYLMTIIRKLS